MTPLSRAIASRAPSAEEGEFMTRCRRVARSSSAGDDATTALGMAAREKPAPSLAVVDAGDPGATASLPYRPPSRLLACVAAIAAADRFRGVSPTSTPERVRGAMTILPPPPPSVSSLAGLDDLPGDFRRLRGWFVAVPVEGGNDEDGPEPLFWAVSASASPRTVADPPPGRLRARRGECRTPRSRAVAVGARGGKTLTDPATARVVCTIACFTDVLI